MAYTNRERVILGPLTTVFKPPGPCTIAVGACATCNVAFWGQTCGPSKVHDDQACWPATTTGAPDPGDTLTGWGFYSPGLKCPEGYTSGCTAIEGKTTGWKLQFQMEAQETFVGCCPTGFKCDNLHGQTCITVVAKTTSLPTVSCDGSSSNNFGFTTIPNEHVTQLNLFAPMIQLAFKASDQAVLSSTTTAATTATNQTTSATSAPTTSLPAATPSPETTSPPSTTPTSLSTTATSLSTGAVVGIAIGTAALVLLIATAAFLLWRRRTPRGSQGAPEPLTGPPGYGYYGDAKQFMHYCPATELGQGHGLAEVSGIEHRREEMFAGEVGWPARREAGEVAEMPVEGYR